MPVPSAHDAFERYRDDLLLGRWRRRHRQATADDYRFPLTDFWAFVAPTPWHRVTTDDYRRYLDRPAHGTTRPLAPNSRALYSTAILDFYRWARWARLLRTNPLEGIRPDPKVEPPARGLELAQVGVLLAATVPHPRTHLAVALCFFAFLRAGEVARLRIEDVDLRGGLLVVHGKGGYVDSVPIHERLRPVLAAALAGRPATGPLLESTRRPGEHVSPRTISRWVGRALAAEGLAESAHVLRHSAAYLFLEQTGNLYALSRLLRHRSLQSTQRYVRRADRRLAKWLAELPAPDPTARRP